MSAACSISSDDWLANGPLADGNRRALVGLDFCLDAQFLAVVSSARSQGRYETLLSDTAEYVDALMNMDI